MGRVVVIGSINMDVVGQAPRIPAPGETLVGTAVSLIPGGKGANQAVAAQRVGGAAAMVGAVGADEFGSTLTEFLGSEGLDINLVGQAKGSSGTALIVVDSAGENSIVIIPGANDTVSAMDVANVKFSNGDVVLLQNEVPEEANVEAAKRARTAGATTVLNLAPFRHSTEDLLELVDFIIVNEIEFAGLTGLDPSGMSSHRIVGLLAQGEGVGRNVIVTLGRDGLHARLGSAVTTISGHPVPVVDTTGAGDCFCGSFGAALARGNTVEDALRFANAAAALSVQKLGAGPSMPTLGEVDAFLIQADVQDVQ